MSEQKTHYRKAFDSPYLSAADVVEPTILTIKTVSLERDKTKKTQESFNTAYFVEKEIRPGEELRPMILNATNSRTMRALTGSPFIEDWAGTAITIYVDANVRFGRDTVEGLRISTEPPRKDKPFLEQGTAAWGHAVAAVKRDKSFDAIEKRMRISGESKAALWQEALGEAYPG